jgi:hypothetical protein
VRPSRSPRRRTGRGHVGGTVGRGGGYGCVPPHRLPAAPAPRAHARRARRYASRPHQHATVCFVPQGVFATGANFGSADAAPPFVGGSTGVRAHRPAVEPITEEAQEKPLTAARSVALCLTAGLVASTLQLAFVLGGSIASAAESIGVSPILSAGESERARGPAPAEVWRSLTRVRCAGVIWLPAFCISGLVNVLYAAWLLTRNETWSCFSFSCVGEPHRWALSLMSAVFFCGHIHLYGTASTLLGTLGPVIAWPVLMCCTMVCTPPVAEGVSSSRAALARVTVPPAHRSLGSCGANICRSSARTMQGGSSTTLRRWCWLLLSSSRQLLL